MVDGKENYKFDLGVKGLTVLSVDWSVIIVLCTEKGWDCWSKAGKAQCATSRRKGMEYNHFELLHCHFLCLRYPQDEKKKGCYHLILVVSHHLLHIYCKINMIFFRDKSWKFKFFNLTWWILIWCLWFFCSPCTINHLISLVTMRILESEWCTM